MTVKSTHLVTLENALAVEPVLIFKEFAKEKYAKLHATPGQRHYQRAYDFDLQWEILSHAATHDKNVFKAFYALQNELNLPSPELLDQLIPL